MLHLIDENYEGVFETADKAMEYNSDNSGLYKYLASAYHQIKEYDKAIDTYNIAFAKADSTDFVELSEIIATLTDREQKIIRLRFGIGSDKALTLAEIGEVMGVTRERIRQIENKAIRKLRHPSRSKKIKDFYC